MRVADNAESWLISNHVNVFDDIDVLELYKSVLKHQFEEAFKCSSALMFIKSEFEMHSHNCEIISILR